MRALCQRLRPLRVLSVIIIMSLVLPLASPVCRAAGTVGIEYLGHSAFILTHGTSKILIDPWWSGSFGLPLYSQFAAAEGLTAVTISHQHGDHDSAAAAPVGTPVMQGTVIDPQSATEAFALVSVAGGGSCGDFAVSNVATIHGDGPTSPNAAFVYEVDGMRIVHLGDSLDAIINGFDSVPGLVAALKGPNGIDILMLPVGGAFGEALAPDKLTSAISALAPKVVIPMHAWGQEQGFLDAAVTSGIAVSAPGTTATYDGSVVGPVIWALSPSITGSATISACNPDSVANASDVGITVTGSGLLTGTALQLTDLDPTDATVLLPVSLAGCTVSQDGTQAAATVPAGTPAGEYRLMAYVPPAAVGLRPNVALYASTFAVTASAGAGQIAATVDDGTASMNSATTIDQNDSTFTVTLGDGLTLDSAFGNDDYTLTGLPAGLAVGAAPVAGTNSIVFAVAGEATAPVTDDISLTLTLKASAASPTATADSGPLTLTLAHYSAPVVAPSAAVTADANGAPADGITVSSSWSAATGLLNIQLKTGQLADSFELAPTYDSNDIFTISVTNNGLTPGIAIGAGDFVSWSTTGDVTTLKIRGMAFKPAAGFSVQCGIMIALQYDLAAKGIPASYGGMYITTNGNMFNAPALDPVTGKMTVTVGGVDGETGAFRAFLPSALLTSWNVTDVAQLSASIDSVAVDDPLVATADGNGDSAVDGMTIGFGMHFSIHSVAVGRDKLAPALHADTTGNIIGSPVDITFADDNTWRAAVTAITLDGADITGQVALTEGKLTIPASLLATAKTYTVRVAATGYAEATVLQTIVSSVAPLPAPPTDSTSIDDTVITDTGTTTTEVNDDGTVDIVATVDPVKVGVGVLTGNLTIDLASPAAETGQIAQRTAEVPVTVLEQLAEAGREVVLDAGVATLEIPPAALTGVDAVSGTAASGGSVSIGIEAIDAAGGQSASADATILAVRESLPAASAQGLVPAGRILALSAEVTGDDGAVTRITRFSQKLTVRIPFDSSANPDLLGIYRLNRETGEWEYRGGRVNREGGYIEIELDGFSEYAVMTCRVDFSDVPASHWASSDIALLAARHIVGGYAGGYSPEAAITRAEFAAMIVRALGLSASAGNPQFSDVKASDWFAKPVAVAASAGLIAGHEGRFRPNDHISREEMAVILSRALDLRGKGVTLSEADVVAQLATFGDSGKIGSWARIQSAELAKLGLFGGETPTTFAPALSGSRAEVAVLIVRLLRIVGEVR